MAGQLLWWHTDGQPRQLPQPPSAVLQVQSAIGNLWLAPMLLPVQLT